MDWRDLEWDDNFEDTGMSEKEIRDLSNEDLEAMGLFDDDFDMPTDSVVECHWCHTNCLADECHYDKDLGWICDRCKRGIESRGEGLDLVDPVEESLEETVPEDLADDRTPKEFTDVLDLEFDNPVDYKKEVTKQKGLEEYFERTTVDSDQELAGTDNAVVDCQTYDLVAHSEDEKPLDCKMEKAPLEKPLTEAIKKGSLVLELEDAFDAHVNFNGISELIIRYKNPIHSSTAAKQNYEALKEILKGHDIKYDETFSGNGSNNYGMVLYLDGYFDNADNFVNAIQEKLTEEDIEDAVNSELDEIENTTVEEPITAEFDETEPEEKSEGSNKVFADLLIDEKEAIDGYNKAIDELSIDGEITDNAKEVLKHIEDEELEHIEELSKVLAGDEAEVVTESLDEATLIPGKEETWTVRRREFRRLPKDSGWSGMSFECDEEGDILDTATDAAKENFKDCLANPDKWEDEGIKTWKSSYKTPSHIKCDICGEDVMITGFTNECDNCGAFYNDAGTLLKHPDEWDPEDRYDVFGPQNDFDESLNESTTPEELEEITKLSNEIGLKTTQDLNNFMRREALIDETPLDALRRYRAELGDDFKLKDSELEEEFDPSIDSEHLNRTEINQLGWYGPAKEPNEFLYVDADNNYINVSSYYGKIYINNLLARQDFAELPETAKLVATKVITYLTKSGSTFADNEIQICYSYDKTADPDALRKFGIDPTVQGTVSEKHWGSMERTEISKDEIPADSKVYYTAMPITNYQKYVRVDWASD